MTGRDNETFWEGEEIHYRCTDPRREGVVLQPGLQGPEGGQVHLHLSSCTLQPEPFTLNPSSWTLHPEPCTLHTALCELHLAALRPPLYPGGRLQDLAVILQVPGEWRIRHAEDLPQLFQEM